MNLYYQEWRTHESVENLLKNSRLLHANPTGIASVAYRGSPAPGGQCLDRRPPPPPPATQAYTAGAFGARGAPPPFGKSCIRPWGGKRQKKKKKKGLQHEKVERPPDA